MVNGIEISRLINNPYKKEANISLRFLFDIKKINIFVGANNSGKSRFLRSLLKSRDCIYYHENIKIENSIRIATIVNKITNNLFNRYGHKLKIGKDDLKTDKLLFKIFHLLEIIDYLIRNCELNNDINLKNNKDMLEDQLKDFMIVPDKHDLQFFSKTYIPILRGCEKFELYYVNTRGNDLNSISLNNDQRIALNEYMNNSKKLYLNKISTVYNIDEDLIFTGEIIYEDIKSKLLGSKEDRKLINDFQDFIRKNFYKDESFEIIPNIKEEVIYVKIGENEHPLHNLGEGIKQLIVMLYIIYINKDNNHLFFIEEPEINLHPGFQRKFIEILQSNEFPNHQFFITTHSNHLIDSTLDFDDISIYKFLHRNDDTFLVDKAAKNDIEILHQLGVNNSSVFMSNCTIWVEGISDKIIISKYLEVFLHEKGCENKYREDIEYSFVEYDGNNITHWNFENIDNEDKIKTSGITNRVFVIADNDNGSKKERKEKLKSTLGNNFYVLDVREIENTLSPKILDSMFLKNKETRKKDFKEKDYKNEYMGKFIDEHYENDNKWSLKEGTGTVNNKFKFSKLAYESINSYNDLSNEAKKICLKLFEFIEKSNTL